jgi:deoxyribonuclease V
VSPSSRCSEDVDLIGLIFEAVGQIPEGNISTYGDIAKAMGDVRAAKAVAQVLWDVDCPEVPRHRVVSADGTLGSGDAISVSDVTSRLIGEGVPVHNGRVTSLEATRFADHQIPPVLRRLQAEQETLRPSVVESDDFPRSACISGVDASYSRDRGCVALVRMDLESLEVVEVRSAVGQVRFPYITGYLAYRELPLIRKVYRDRDQDILLIDGQGVLHPRGFGIASQVGVCLDVATIGAAKSHLVGAIEGDGARAKVLVDGKLKGMRLSPKGGKGIFVSVGHRVSLTTACAYCERLMIGRTPEPLRLAHVLATRRRKELEMES